MPPKQQHNKQKAPRQPTEGVNNCIVAAWKERTADTHDRIMQQLDVMKTPEVVFLGDSLMERWKTSGKEKWGQLTSKQKILNAGIGGDKVQNVLWRLEKGLFENMKPKIIFFMIGTNNIEKNSPKHIAEGTAKIIEIIHEKSPGSVFITYGVLPRKSMEKMSVPVMDKVQELNSLVREMAVTKFADFMTFHDIGAYFLQEGSTNELRDNLYDDKVHIGAKGYDIWYELISKELAERL
jgi:lysophospholipase L1-like esterase